MNAKVKSEAKKIYEIRKIMVQIEEKGRGKLIGKTEPSGKGM